MTGLFAWISLPALCLQIDDWFVCLDESVGFVSDLF